jgi:hypothetical protein
VRHEHEESITSGRFDNAIGVDEFGSNNFPIGPFSKKPAKPGRSNGGK